MNKGIIAKNILIKYTVTVTDIFEIKATEDSSLSIFYKLAKEKAFSKNERYPPTSPKLPSIGFRTFAVVHQTY
jgi:hypothetical protein